MDRLCERPGCSEPASVAYGMRPEDLVFWLDVLIAGDDDGRGVLCRRHADTMVVPRGWTLDDLRDPDLHLFRPPPPVAVAPVRRRRSTGDATAPDGIQLSLDETSVDGDHVVESGPAPTWTPAFDDADDLGGLLAARSPLLARAFHGADRQRNA